MRRNRRVNEIGAERLPTEGIAIVTVIQEIGGQQQGTQDEKEIDPRLASALKTDPWNHMQPLLGQVAQKDQHDGESTGAVQTVVVAGRLAPVFAMVLVVGPGGGCLINALWPAGLLDVAANNSRLAQGFESIRQGNAGLVH
jgi:hypothetical protein